MVLGSRLRPQRLAQMHCCKRLLSHVAQLLKDGPGLLETGDRPVVLSMNGKAAPEVDACRCMPRPVAKLPLNGQGLLEQLDRLVVLLQRLVTHAQAVARPRLLIL